MVWNRTLRFTPPSGKAFALLAERRFKKGEYVCLYDGVLRKVSDIEQIPNAEFYCYNVPLQVGFYNFAILQVETPNLCHNRMLSLLATNHDLQVPLNLAFNFNLRPLMKVNDFDFTHLMPAIHRGDGEESDLIVLDNSGKGGVGRFVNDCWGQGLADIARRVIQRILNPLFLI